MGKMKIAVDRPCVKPGVTFERRADGRFCLSCQELQHDLRDATFAEALALMDANGGRICGTFRTGPAGELQFKPEPPSLVGRAARGAALALALAGCGSSDTPAADPVVTTASPPPTSAPPSTIAVETPPPTVIEAPPPTTTVPATTLPDTVSSATHTTDGSVVASDHAGHWHTHPRVPIGGHHISGGATSFQPPVEGAPSGTVRFEPLRITQEGLGEMDRALLVARIRERQSMLRACYLRVLRSQPTVSGDVVCSMSVGATGVVSDASIVSDSTGSSELGPCAVSVLRRLRFEPGPEGGPVVYQIPFHFELQDPFAE